MDQQVEQSIKTKTKKNKTKKEKLCVERKMDVQNQANELKLDADRSQACEHTR